MPDTFALRITGRFGRALVALYPIVLLLILWEIVTRLGYVRPLFLPPFSVVVKQLYLLALDGELLPPLLTSLYRTVVGLGLAMIVGIPLGFLMVRSRFMQWLLDPLVAFGLPAPKIALIPVFTLWFGIDHMAKIMLVALTSVFPFIVAAAAGARTVVLNQIWAARAMGSSELTLLRRVVLPASLPSLMSGLRVAVPIGLLTTFTTEMVAGGGLGGALVMAQRYFESPTVYAYLLMMLFCGYVTDVGLLRLRHRVLRWHEG
jgi:ABC-type nitrate/sulfonate/bicarbonate transport system permease component